MGGELREASAHQQLLQLLNSGAKQGELSQYTQTQDLGRNCLSQSSALHHSHMVVQPQDRQHLGAAKIYGVKIGGNYIMTEHLL